MGKELIKGIFDTSESSFYENAFKVFQYQKKTNDIYRQWIETLAVAAPEEITDIPFLPVSFFKTHRVVSGIFDPEILFTSSGTTGMETSRHFVKSLDVYETSFFKGFELFYGPVRNYCVLALLPSYLERSGSSLVYMAERMIQASQHSESAFHLYDFEALRNKLERLLKEDTKVLLLGVSFALLDFAEMFPMHLNDRVTVMETGGMKGRKKEMVRNEVHTALQANWNLQSIHAEYGMTELLSQAYSKGGGRFMCPPWMKVLVRDEDDPFVVKTQGRGLINIIDLANLYSCSFIATDDIGMLYEDGSFEILGRSDNSDIRGCSLLIA